MFQMDVQKDGQSQPITRSAFTSDDAGIDVTITFSQVRPVTCWHKRDKCICNMIYPMSSL